MSGDGRTEEPGQQPPERRELDLALRVLDQQLVDWGGRRCGRVDDVELAGEPGGPLRVTALLAGQAALRPRLPRVTRFLARTWGDPPLTVVPWAEVEEVSAVVKLKRPAEELGLGRGEEKAHRLVGRLPRS